MQDWSIRLRARAYLSGYPTAGLMRSRIRRMDRGGTSASVCRTHRMMRIIYRIFMVKNRSSTQSWTLAFMSEERMLDSFRPHFDRSCHFG